MCGQLDNVTNLRVPLPERSFSPGPFAVTEISTKKHTVSPRLINIVANSTDLSYSYTSNNICDNVFVAAYPVANCIVAANKCLSRNAKFRR